MELLVKATNSQPIAQDTRLSIEAQVGEALGVFGRDIQGMTVFLSDENGPRGGIGKTCRIVADIPGGPVLVAEETAENLVIAVDQATEDMVILVRKYWDRLRTLERVPAGPITEALPDQEEAAPTM
jgi:putative sigma-54 modulation protein